MLRDAARAFLDSRAPLARVRELAETPSGFDSSLWVEEASLGWTGLLAPERFGGSEVSGNGVIAAAVLAEELGRGLHPGPYLGASVTIDAIARSGNDEQRGEIIPPLVEGVNVAAWAIADGPGSWSARGGDTIATPRSEGVVVSGRKRWVLDGQNADLFLVSCAMTSTGVVQCVIPSDAPGVAVEPLETMDPGRRLADVRFSEVEVEPRWVLKGGEDASDDVARQLQLAVVLQLAETVGLSGRVLERTVEYAKQRIAFGRPIGAFQAVKHHLAHAVTMLEASQAATWAAVRAIANGASDAPRATHVAKVFTADRCVHIIEDCMQVLGGIAMTWEDDSHLFLRRVASNRMLFGSPEWHADRICDLVGVVS